MIILDTNVVFEAVKINRNIAVVKWLDNQTAETLYLTAISLSELLIGVEILPPGKRKEGLSAGLADLLSRLFGARVLSFDREAAASYSVLVGKARAAGKAVSVPDGQIGAIATVHGFTVATRDTIPFAALGVPVINSWSDHKLTSRL
ncbi:type II toxin-antitoxin system VapC family toxin [soil metagenome]